MVFFVEIVKVRDARPAGRTPCRPEFDQQRVARKGRFVAKKFEIRGEGLTLTRADDSGSVREGAAAAGAVVGPSAPAPALVKVE
jgi:hypothetical protein